MDILIADALAPQAAAGLEALGLRVTTTLGLSPHELPTALAGVHVLVVTRTRVTRRALEQASSLGLIVCAGTQTDPVDVAAASERGVFVAHCPGFDASSRAELALGMLVALDRGLGSPAAGLASNPPGLGSMAAAPARGLAGATLGLLGFDPTAARLAAIAHAMEMRVVAWSSQLTPSLASEHHLHLATDRDRLLTRANAVVISPDGDGGAGGVGAPDFAKASGGTTFIDVSGRGLMDLGAAAKSVATGHIRVGVDVESDERCPLDGLDGALVTHRVGAETDQGGVALAGAVVRIVNAFALRSEIPWCVNRIEHPDGPAVLVVRHVNAVGSLASFLNVLRDENVNVLDCRSTLLAGAKAASTSFRLSAVPGPDLLKRIGRSDMVLHVDLVLDPAAD